MIEIVNLTYQYPHAETPLFDSVNLHIPADSMTLVSGPSGSGKSTLLRLINGLVPHFSGGRISGQITVFGSNPITEGPEKMAGKIGFVFQEPEAQFVYETVEDEIAFTLENLGLTYPEMHQRVMDTLEAFDLAPLRMRSLYSLSGGEKQKVALASVMVSKPRVLLLDEPTSQLDPRSAEGILDFILHLKSQYGLTVLISEHRLERMLPFIDHIINIDMSHKVMFGSPQEILTEMKQVPPIIDLGCKFKLSPLPLRVKDFPKELADRSPQQSLQPEIISNKNPALIELRDFSVHIAGQNVLDQINLEIKPAEILTILGPNGAGKTTLLRALLGLVPSLVREHLLGMIYAPPNFLL
jgi:energy-coupling factor transport system ATP-binding protein